jgi:acyl transferase domain-containing protein/NAD(P)-dependent dehydrogenase (short-subunit alcohol dehydrogenase family)/acyl carrier protein
VCEGVDAVREVPADRWNSSLFCSAIPQLPGKAYVRSGGFLRENIFAFDALFFGVSPREAAVLDPQQRLLLEVTYEAIEDAGLPLKSLKNSRTGVFVGGFTLDNMLEQLHPLNLELLDAFTPASLTMTMLSNRISYTFGLQGPSMTVDTACSSSLVATHLGCQSIWAGESDMVIAGGVNVLLRPEFFAMLSKGRFLSTHGRCKSYDKAAAGYARAEGAGVAILKPLPRAIEDGDHIWAVIRNTAVNQDGTTAGISSPNEAAQRTLLSQLFRDAGVSPRDVHYVEAHGTGTQAGDRAETSALHHVLAEGRPPGDKCLVGSIKTNIGHTEGAAGIAGLIKCALTVATGQIPPNLHFSTPNPEIPFGEMCIRVPTRPEQWPHGDKTRLACVSSFGYGGTNAAAVLEAPPVPKRNGAQPPARSESEPPALVPLSARSVTALGQLARRHADHLASHPHASWVDLLHSLCFRRSHFKHRVALLAADAQSLEAALRDFSRGAAPEWTSAGTATEDVPPPLVFVFTGMGPQHARMGMDLFRREKPFRDAMLRCDEIFRRISGLSILDELAADERSTRIGLAQIAQPANLFVQIALTEQVAYWGIRPDVVVGHSVGEVAAAYASGALSLEDALLVSHQRGRLQQELSGSGTLLAVECSEDEGLRLFRDMPEVSIAAINGPSSLTLAGDVRSLTAAKRLLDGAGRFAKFLDVAIPYHSPKMDAIAAELLHSLEGLRARQEKVPLYSTVTGDRIRGVELDASYWWRNVRETVRFADAIGRILIEAPDCHFLEVGPHPVLRASLLQCLKTSKATGRPLQTLNRKTPETLTLRQSLGALYCLGYEPQWREVTVAQGRYARLPKYPWQREVHSIRRTARAVEQLHGGGGHPLLAHRLDAAFPSWQVEVSSDLHLYVQDHRVSGEVVVPGAVYLEAGLAGHFAQTSSEACVLEDVTFHKMLLLDPQEPTRLSVTVDPRSGRFEVHARKSEEPAAWSLHAGGSIREGVAEPGTVDAAAFEMTCSEPHSTSRLYERLAEMGLVYGPAFRTVTQLRTDPCFRNVLVRLEGAAADAGHYLLHPTLIDGAFQALVSLAQPERGAAKAPMVPVSIERLSFHGRPKSSLHAFGTLTHMDAAQIEADLVLFDDEGQVIARLDGIHCRSITAQDVPQDPLDRWFYEHAWEPLPAEASSPPRAGANGERWLILGDEVTAKSLVQDLTRAAIPHVAAVRARTTQLEREPPALHPEDLWGMRELIRSTAGAGLSHVVYLWSFDPPGDGRQEDELVDRIMPLRNLVEVIREVAGERPVKIVAVTREAHVVTVGDTGRNLVGSTIGALGRVIENEYANIRFQHVDFDTEAGFSTRVTALLRSGSEEREIAIRGDRAWTRRLKRAPGISQTGRRTSRTYRCRDTRVEFRPLVNGQAGPLLFQEAPRVEPGPDEVEIRVHSASMDGQDLLAGARTSKTSFSGVVTKIGSRVQSARVGEAVMGVGAGRPSSYLVAPALTTTRRPARVSPQDATALGAFLSAYYSLVEVARLKRGERLLVQGAATPIGLAALEIARWIGADAIAAVSDDGAARHIEDRGVTTVHAPGAVLPADRINADSGRAGLDVVLDAAPGNAPLRGLELLAPLGRLIAVGKSDSAEDVYLPSVACKRNLSFASIDIARLRVERPHHCASLLAEVSRLFADGALRTIPVTAMPAGAAAEGLRALENAIGGLALTFDGAEVEATPVSAEPLFRKDGTYLVTGGTKGFGLEVAKWIASEGGGHLLLASRGGADDSTRSAIAAMEAAGARVTVSAGDVGEESRLQEIVREVRNSMPPLRGIFHAAVVLEDALLADLTAEGLGRSLHAKVGGLWNLHVHTRECPLDVFLCFSSVSALIGNTGQASYVVGNSYLDAFALHRRSLGLPCTSVNFGALSGVGILSRRTNVGEFFKRHGVNSMAPDDVCSALGRAIRADVAQVGIFDVDWATLAMAMPVVRSSPVFAELAPGGDRPGRGGEDQLTELRGQLSMLGPEARDRWLRDRIGEEVSRVLGISRSLLDPDERLAKLGIDSLSAVELAVGLRASLGVEFSAVNLLNVASVSRLAADTSDKLGLD